MAGASISKETKQASIANLNYILSELGDNPTADKLIQAIENLTKKIDETKKEPSSPTKDKNLKNLEDKLSVLTNFKPILENFQKSLEENRKIEKKLAEALLAFQKSNESDTTKLAQAYEKEKKELIASNLAVTKALYEIIHQKPFSQIQQTKLMKDGKPVIQPVVRDDTGKKSYPPVKGAENIPVFLEKWLNLQVQEKDVAERNEKLLALMYNEFKNFKTIFVKNPDRGPGEKARKTSVRVRLNDEINVIPGEQLGYMATGQGGTVPLTPSQAASKRGAKIPGIDASDVPNAIKTLAGKVKEIESKAKDKSLSEDEQKKYAGLQKTLTKMFSSDVLKILRSENKLDDPKILSKLDTSLARSRRIKGEDKQQIVPLLKELGLNFTTDEKKLTFKEGKGREFHTFEQMTAQIQQIEGLLDHVINYFSEIRNSTVAKKTAKDQDPDAVSSYISEYITGFSGKLRKLLTDGVTEAVDTNEITTAMATGLVKVLADPQLWGVITADLASAMKEVTPRRKDGITITDEEFAKGLGEKPNAGLPRPKSPKEIKTYSIAEVEAEVEAERKQRKSKKPEDLPIYGLVELEPILKAMSDNLLAIKNILIDQLSVQKRVAELISGKFITTVQQAMSIDNNPIQLAGGKPGNKPIVPVTGGSNTIGPDIYPFDMSRISPTTGRAGENIGYGLEMAGTPVENIMESIKLLENQKIAFIKTAEVANEYGMALQNNQAMQQLNMALNSTESLVGEMDKLKQTIDGIKGKMPGMNPTDLAEAKQDIENLTGKYQENAKLVSQRLLANQTIINKNADLESKLLDKLNEKEKERASILAAQQAIQGRQDVISKYGTEITKKLDPVMMDQAKRGISGISPNMTSTIANYATSAKSEMEKNNEQLKFYKQSEVKLKNIIDLEKNLAELRAMQEKGVSGDEQVKQYKKIQDIVQNIEVQRADSAKIINNITEDNQKQLKQTLKLTGKLFEYEKEIAEYKDDQVGKEHAIKELRLQTDAFEALTKTMRKYGTDSKNIDDGRINAMQDYLALTEEAFKESNNILAAHGKQVTSMEDLRNIQAKIIKFQEIQRANGGKMTDESIRLYEEISKGVVHVENVARKATERVTSTQLEQQKKMKDGVDALTATWMKHLGSVTRTMKSSLNSLFGNILRIKIILGTIGYTLQREIKEGLIQIYRVTQQIVQTTEQISIMKTTLGDIFSPTTNFNNEAFANTLVESVAKVTIGLGDMDGKIKRIPVSFAEAVTSIKGMAAIPGLKSFFFGRGAGDMSPDAIDAKVGNLLKAVQALQLIDPSQGVEGAMFSLREALSGDFISLKRRFEIQPHFLSQAIGKSVEELKNDPNLFLEGLSEYFESNFASVFEKMVQNPQGLIETIRSSIQYLMNAVGSGPKGLLKMVSERILMPVRDLFIGFLQSNEFKRITVLIQDKYASIFNSLQKLFDPSKFSGVLVDMFSTLFGSQVNTGGNQFSSLEKSIQVISEFIDEGIEKSIKYVIQNKGQILSLIENIKVMVGQIVKFIIPFGDKFMNTILPGMLKLLEWVSSNSFLMMLSTLAMLLGVGNTLSGIGGMIQFGGAALAQQAMAHAVTPGKGVVSQLFGKTLGLEVAGQYLLSGSHGANALNRLANVDVSKMASENVDVARYLSHRDDIKKGLIPAAGGTGTGGTTVIGGTSLFGKMMPQGFGKMPFQQTGGLFSGPAGGWTAGAAGGVLLASIIPAIVAGVVTYMAQTGLEWMTKDRKGVKDDSIYLMMQEGEYWKNIKEQFKESKGVVGSFFAAIRLGFQSSLGLVNEGLLALHNMVTGWTKNKKAEDVFLNQMKNVFSKAFMSNTLTTSGMEFDLYGSPIQGDKSLDTSLIKQFSNLFKQQLGSAYNLAGGGAISADLSKIRQKDTWLPEDKEEIDRLLIQREMIFNKILPIQKAEIQSYLPILEDQLNNLLRREGISDTKEIENTIANFRIQFNQLLTNSITQLTTDFADELRTDPRFQKAIDTGLIQANVSTLVARIEQSNIGFSEYVNTLMGLQDQIRWMVPTKAQMLMRKDMGKQAEAMEALLEPTAEGSGISKFDFAFKNFTDKSQIDINKIATNVLGTIFSTLGDDDKYKEAVSKLVELGTKDYNLSNESDLVEILKIMNNDKFKSLMDLVFTKDGKLNVDDLKGNVEKLGPLMAAIGRIGDDQVKDMLLTDGGAFKEYINFNRTQLIKQYLELTGKDFKKVVQAQKKALVEMQLQTPNYSGVVQNIMDARKELKTQEEVRKTFGTKEGLQGQFEFVEFQVKISEQLKKENNKLYDAEYHKKMQQQLEKLQSEVNSYDVLQSRNKELGDIYKQQIELGVDQYIALLKKDIMEVNKAVKFSRVKSSASILTAALKFKEMEAKAPLERAAAMENPDIAGTQIAVETEKERTKTLTKLTPVLFKQYMTQMNRDFEKQVIGFKYLDTHKPEDIEKYMANLSQLLDSFNPEELKLVAGKSLTEQDYTNIGIMRDKLSTMLNDSQIVLVEAYMGMMDKTIRSLSNEAKRQMTQLENMTAKIPKGSKWDQYKVDFGGRSIVPRYGSSGTFASSGYFAKGGLYGTNQETLREMARYSGMLRSESTTSMSIKARKMGTQQFVDKFSQMLPQAKETFERIFPEMITASEKKIDELTLQISKTETTSENYKILNEQLVKVKEQHEEILESQKQSFLSLENATEEYNKMVDMLGDNSAFKAFHEGLMNMYRDFSNFEEQLALSFNNTGQILGRTMDDFFFNVFKGQIQDAKQVWSGFMRSIWDEFARTLSKMMSQNIIKGLFGGLMGEGSFGGGTGWLTNIFGSFGGGTKPTSGIDSIRAKIAQLPTSARANGGLITRPEIALLGEGRNNPEVVMNNTQLHQHLQSAVSRTIGEMKPRMSQSSGKSIQMTNNFRFEVTGSTNQETQENMEKMMMALPEIINEQVRMTINEDDNVQESIKTIARQSYV